MAETLGDRIVNGKIVRSGFYRDADGSGVTYAKKVQEGTMDADCIFCPEGIQRHSIKIVRRIGEQGCGAFVMETHPSYAHFDAQRMLDHKMIVPDQHITSKRQMDPDLRDLIEEYINEVEDTAPEGVAIQDYTRRQNNPSKSIGHLHTHLFTLSFAPLSRFAFDIDNGVTEIEFIEPTIDEIQAIERSRL